MVNLCAQWLHMISRSPHGSELEVVCLLEVSYPRSIGCAYILHIITDRILRVKRLAGDTCPAISSSNLCGRFGRLQDVF